MIAFYANLTFVMMMRYNSMNQNYNTGKKNKKYGCSFPDHYKNIAANIINKVAQKCLVFWVVIQLVIGESVKCLHFNNLSGRTSTKKRERPVKRKFKQAFLKT